MSRRDILHRMAGVGLLLGAGGSAMLHKEVWQVHAAGPATGQEAVLGLLTFTLASLGLLLMTCGSKLRDGWKRDCERAARRRRRVMQEGNKLDKKAEGRASSTPPIDFVAFANGRTAIATFVVIRARKAAARAKLEGKTSVTEKYEPGTKP